MTLREWGDLAMLLGLLCAAPVAAAVDMHLAHLKQRTRKAGHGR